VRGKENEYAISSYTTSFSLKQLCVFFTLIDSHCLQQSKVKNLKNKYLTKYYVKILSLSSLTTRKVFNEKIFNYSVLESS